MPAQMRSISLLISLFAGGVLLVGHWLPALGEPPGASEAKPKAEAEDSKKRGIGLVVTPLPDWFKFQSKDTVNGWIDTDDNKAIVSHAWELWGALTSLTPQELNGQKVPVYETWRDADEDLLPP